ncbi:MAG TPA: hypothetical protein VEV16_10080, partial [Daejeonella sp.]|nr:hypothetical protein [Daejeonella sp.]
MLKHLICITLLLCCLLTRGNTIEIRYHVPNVKNVTMIWGVNDWNIASEKPKGTIIQDKVMHTPMVKEG